MFFVPTTRYVRCIIISMAFRFCSNSLESFVFDVSVLVFLFMWSSLCACVRVRMVKILTNNMSFAYIEFVTLCHSSTTLTAAHKFRLFSNNFVDDITLVERILFFFKKNLFEIEFDRWSFQDSFLLYPPLCVCVFRAFFFKDLSPWGSINFTSLYVDFYWDYY